MDYVVFAVLMLAALLLMAILFNLVRVKYLRCIDPQDRARVGAGRPMFVSTILAYGLVGGAAAWIAAQVQRLLSAHKNWTPICLLVFGVADIALAFAFLRVLEQLERLAGAQLTPAAVRRAWLGGVAGGLVAVTAAGSIVSLVLYSSGQASAWSAVGFSLGLGAVLLSLRLWLRSLRR